MGGLRGRFLLVVAAATAAAVDECDSITISSLLPPPTLLLWGEADSGFISKEEVDNVKFVRGIFDGWSDNPPTLLLLPTPFMPMYPMEEGGALGGIIGSPISCLTRSASARFMVI